MGARISFSSGTTPRTNDSRWVLLAKWLIALASPDPALYPHRTDSKRELLRKIDLALGG